MALKSKRDTRGCRKESPVVGVPNLPSRRILQGGNMRAVQSRFNDSPGRREAMTACEMVVVHDESLDLMSAKPPSLHWIFDDDIS